jgi:predicted nicotinamide N-methyase
MNAPTASEHSQSPYHERCRKSSCEKSIRHWVATVAKHSVEQADDLEAVATYQVPITRSLEDSDMKRSTVWRFRD